MPPNLRLRFPYFSCTALRLAFFQNVQFLTNMARLGIGIWNQTQQYLLPGECKNSLKQSWMKSQMLENAMDFDWFLENEYGLAANVKKMVRSWMCQCGWSPWVGWFGTQSHHYILYSVAMMNMHEHAWTCMNMHKTFATCLEDSATFPSTFLF